MMLDEQQLQTLLRLKRYEQPPPGYFEHALTEFHRRQRQELLRRSAFQIWFERFVSSLWSFRVPNYAYGVAFGIFMVAASIVGSGVWAPTRTAIDAVGGLSGITATPSAIEVSTNRLALSGRLDWSKFDRSTVSHRVVPALDPSQTALPRYVLDGRPVSYEASFSF
ncbi:MAG TPA: hypothetical protein VE860_25300 [Chthoniobacterales bacterium]|nr:hypothetical protein [Chthoniobacterales bacterium]